MTGKFSEAKLLYITSDQKLKLKELQKEVISKGGEVSLNQIIRDAIDILTYSYKDRIVERYIPRSIKELVRKG